MTQYLALLFPDAPDDAWLVVSWLQGPNDFRSQWFMMAQQADAIAWLLRVSPLYNTYIGLGLRHPQCQPSSTSRGTSAEVCAIGGLWVELDHTAGVHSATNLPTPDELTTFLHTMPFEWSLLVDSGGGIHAYLLFRELWYLTSQEEYARAALLLRRFQRGIQAQASNHGWKVDSTADLARVLRPAGTINHKGTAPLPVHVCHESDTRYNPLDIDTASWVPVIEDMYTSPLEGLTFPATDLERITAGCAWLTHCQTDAAALPEPEWYAMLGIVGRCADGVAAAHDWSSSYQGYTVEATTKKLEHALAAAGPRTCATIRYDLGGEVYCQQCPNWQKVKSPIVLGMAAKATLEVNGHGPGGAAPIGWSVPDFDWRKELFTKKTASGLVPTQNYFNITRILRCHEYWRRPENALWFDVMRSRHMCGDMTTKSRLVKISTWFGETERLALTNLEILRDCLHDLCEESPRDPLQLWVNGLAPWDGIRRLDTWLQLTASAEDDAYSRDVSRILVVGMIARALDPGCQYRYVVILEGAENTGKSTLVRTLAGPEWYYAMKSDFESKEAHMEIQGCWLAELPELDTLNRTGERRLKSFITLLDDAWIPKYANELTTAKRRTVFVGTINPEGPYLQGQTGNTRIVPLETEAIFPTQLAMIREQLFAEAKQYYYGHLEDWWDFSSEGRAIWEMKLEARRIATPFEDLLQTWLLTPLPDTFPPQVRTTTTWQEIAERVLKIDSPEKWKDKGMQMDIAKAMRALGWRHNKRRVTRGEPPRWIWESPVDWGVPF